MPKLPTAEEVFGARSIPQAQRNIVGYDTSAISQANIRSGATIENTGESMFALGEELRRQDEIEDRRIKEEAERANVKYDAILEARARSDYLLKSLEIKDNMRSDPNYDFQKGVDELAVIKNNYAGGFKTMEGASAFDIYDKTTVANLAYDLKGIALTRQQNAFLADLDDQDEKLSVAMSQSKDLNEIAELAKVRRQLNKSKRAVPGVDEDSLYKRDRAISQDIGFAYYNSLNDEQKREVLYGGGEEDAIGLAVRTHGDVADETAIRKLVMLESGGNPNAKTGSYVGLFQMGDAAAKDVGVKDYSTTEGNAEAGVKYYYLNKGRLEKELDRDDIQPYEIYLAHQQGVAGYKKLLAAGDDEKAVDVIDRDHVRRNVPKGTDWENMTAGEFIELWKGRFENAEPAYVGDPAWKGTPLEALDHGTIMKLRDTYDAEVKAKEKAALDALEIPKLTQMQNENVLVSDVLNNPAMPLQEKMLAIRKADLEGTIRSEWASDAVSFLTVQKPREEDIPPEERAAAFQRVSDMQKEIYLLSGGTVKKGGDDVLSPPVLKKYEEYRNEIIKLTSQGKITPSESRQFLEGITGAIDSAIEGKKSGGDWGYFSAPGINDYNYYALNYIDEYLKKNGQGNNVGLKRDIFSRFSNFLGEVDEAGKLKPTGEYKSTGNWSRDDFMIKVAVKEAIAAANSSAYFGVVDPNNPPNAVVSAPTNIPKVGEVKNGYKFLGGDPSKKENWEKVNG